ncbi:MAG: hypothetical protein IJW64_00245 [Clostridia bacterium]|nr:hypothetical protein [Clostridia bacterium]
MKIFNLKMKTFLISVLSVIAIAFTAIAFAPNFYSAKADGAIASNVYQTDGSSVRVFEKDSEGNFIETQRTGIRFHVEMGVGYVYGGKEVINTNATNERNGSFVLNEGFKTYTLILPTRILGVGENLSINSAKVLKLDTSEYWFYDSDKNLESVAYLWNIPTKRYTDTFSFCGVLCTVDANGNETVVAQTDVAVRCIAEVSKLARQTALDEAEEGKYRWGEDLHDTSLEILEGFIPTYTLNYTTSNGTKTSETVLWGDAPQNVPTDNVLDSWYDTKASEEIDLSGVLTFAESRTLTLQTTTSNEFVLTGVASHDTFKINGNVLDGFKVFATLHNDGFEYNQELDIHAVNAQLNGATFAFTHVYTMEEGGQMRLFFECDTTKLKNGDEIVIQGDSVFYANGVMYKLTANYTIDVTVTTVGTSSTTDFGMFLGYLNNSHVKSIYNAPEDTDEDGIDDEWTIRVEFHDDIMITDNFTFVHDSSSNPVYVQRLNETDPSKFIPILGGEYYWNNGEFKILELLCSSASSKESSAYGLNTGDELKGLAGTKLVQNGGYYIFEDEMYAKFVASSAPEYERTGGYWTVGSESGSYGASEFDEIGSNVEPYIDGDREIREVRINTAHRWFTNTPSLSIENMSDSATYGAYFTKADGTVIEINEFVYHGQDNGSGGNYQILGIRGNIGETAGDMITIVGGTRLWSGNVYYTINETVTFYYNGTYWVKNFDGTYGELNSSSFNGRTYHNGSTQIRMHFTAPLAGLTETDNSLNSWQIGKGSITMNGIRYTSLTYYYWDANMVFLIIDQGTASVSPVGIDLFQDTLVIEEGTTLWSGTVAYKFTERLEFRYIGYEPAGDMPQAWVLVRDNNVNVANSNLSWVSNDTSNGGEVRLWLSGNGKVLNTDYYGEMVIDTRNPVIFNGNTVTKGHYYNQTNNMVSLVYSQGVNDGDYFIVPKGSVWWTPQNGTVTFTEEIFYTYVNGNWVNGDYRSNVTINANNASVTGLEHTAKGQAYTFKVTANSGYVVSKVVINGVEQTLNANGTYTLTAGANNTVTIETIVGYTIKFVIGDGATIDGISNDEVFAMASGTTKTFTVNVAEGYKLTSVVGATDSGNNSYTVTANEHKTVTISTEKLYQVTFSASNATATITADGTAIDSGEWVDNGTQLVFTVSANSGYVLIAVSGATKQSDNVYETTVNGADVNVTATIVASSSIIDVSDTITITQDDWMTSGGNATDCTTFSIRVTNASGGYLYEYLKANSSIRGYWNDNGPTYANTNGVDILDYLHFNGESARNILTKNANGTTSYSGTTFPFSKGGILSPIALETTDSFTKFMVLKAWMPENSFVVITIKSGFQLLLDDGNVITTTKDVKFSYANGTIAKIEVFEELDVTDTITLTKDDWMTSGGNATDCTTFSIRVNNASGGYRYEYLVANSSIQGYWNDNGSTYTTVNDVDIMDYLYFNGKSARSIVSSNTSYTGTTSPLSKGGIFSPIAVETTSLFTKFMVLKTWMPSNLTITIKSGFKLLLNDGNIIFTTKDVSFTYSNDAISKNS